MFAFAPFAPAGPHTLAASTRSVTCARRAESEEASEPAAPAAKAAKAAPAAKATPAAKAAPAAKQAPVAPVGGTPEATPNDVYSPYLSVTPKKTFSDSPAPDAKLYNKFYKEAELFKAPVIRIVHTPGTDGAGSEVGLEMVEVSMGDATEIKWSPPQTKQPVYVPQSSAGNMNKKWV